MFVLRVIVLISLLPFFSVFPQKLQGRGGGGKMVLSDVKAVMVSSKPPMADDSMRTSTGGRCGFGASAPSLTRASPMHFLETREGPANS